MLSEFGNSVLQNAQCQYLSHSEIGTASKLAPVAGARVPDISCSAFFPGFKYGLRYMKKKFLTEEDAFFGPDFFNSK